METKLRNYSTHHRIILHINPATFILAQYAERQKVMSLLNKKSINQVGSTFSYVIYEDRDSQLYWSLCCVNAFDRTTYQSR